MMQSFKTHDNGARPFQVSINFECNDVHVKRIYPEDADSFEMSWSSCDRIFLGRCDKSGLVSSVLLCHHGHAIYIGTNIYSFHPYAPIISYNSPIIGSDVAYPYAYDSDGNVYLLIEHVMFHKDTMMFESEPYTYYYYANKITNDQQKPFHYKKFGHYFKNICKFFVDDNEYILNSDCNPLYTYEEEYYRMRKINNGVDEDIYDEDLIVEYDDGSRHILSCDEYVCLMQEYNMLMGFADIPDIHMIETRKI